MLSLFLTLTFLTPITSSAEVFRAEIRGTINPATSRYLERAIEDAESAKAELLLVELDTPGGLVSSVREMAQNIDKAKVPVVVFTTPAGASATSAGAVLMISSHIAAMAPGTNIGAAHPVTTEGEIKGAMEEKAVNDVSAFVRAMAELRKRNPAAASEVVTKSKSHTAEEALKVKLIDFVVPDQNALWKAIDQHPVVLSTGRRTLSTNPVPSVRDIAMTPGEKVLHYVAHPNIAALLMTLGILLIYFELSAPGLGIGGVLGAVSLIVAFIAFQALPIQLGGLVLLIAGAILLIIEVFTGTGVLAVGGIIAFLLGLLWVVDPAETDLRISHWVIGSIALIMSSGAVLVSLAVSRIRRQSDKALKEMGGGDAAGLRGYRAQIETISQDGRTGTIRIRGELWNFSAIERMSPGDQVTVVKPNGLTVEVIKHQESKEK